jgi:diguanylate cyclase (GGDEF)-like protein/PAS domain S-box-containing protein
VVCSSRGRLSRWGNVQVNRTSEVGLDFPVALDAGQATDLSLAAATTARWEIDLRDGQLHWSASMVDLIGVADDLLGIALLEIVAPLVSAAQSNGAWQPYHLEHEQLVAGFTRTLRVYAVPFGEPDLRGAPFRLAGIVTDVSQHRTDERTIADLIDRYRLLVELSPDGLVVHQSGVIVYANPSACRFVAAVAETELVGRPITDFVDMASRKEMLGRIAALSTPGAVSSPAELTLVALDGTLMVVESTSVRTTWETRAAFQVILRDLSAQKDAEAALRHRAALVEQVSDGIIATDNAGTITSWNPAAETIYGRNAKETIGRPLTDVIGVYPRPGDRLEGVHFRADGRRIDVRIAVAALRDAHDAVNGQVVVCSDLTERRLAEQRFATVVASLQEGVVVVGRDGCIESVNPAAEKLFGQLAGAVVGSRLAALGMVDRDRNLLVGEACPGARTRATGDSEELVVGLCGAGGESIRWLLLTARALLVTDRPNYSVVLSLTDVTERLAAAAALEYQATHDPLTALANRALIVESLSKALASVDRDGGQLSVVFIDLDHFKVINDSLTHGIGDKVLVEIGQRLSAALGDDDVVGRLGGDEFVVMSRAMSTVAEAEMFAERLRSAIATPMSIAGRNLIISASAGVVAACAPVSGNADDMLRDADVAMYQAKNRGRDRYELFDHALRARALRRLQLEEDLRLAIAGDDLWVAYQPIVAADSALISGTEALVRWEHPTLGSISPEEFISVAEESGLILPLGARVLELACEQTARWRAVYPELAHLTVSVNLSARQLADPELLGTVRQVLHRTGLPAAALWLEITESMLMIDPESASTVLRALHADGIRLSIDDFGTGYSSLAYLRRFPVEMLKIDRAFTMAMNDSADDEAIIVSITALAHTLGMRVVAEGVEEVRQLDKLRELGCDYVQGYLLGRPAAASSVRQTLLKLAPADGHRATIPTQVPHGPIR